MSLLRRLANLSGREWRDLWEAQLALLRAQWHLRRVPVGTLVGRPGPSHTGADGSATRAAELGLAIERAAERGIFRPRCLARSLALRDLLERNGVRGSTIRVGVRQEQGRLLAHAWVRWGDEVLGDRADWVARFTEVNDLRVFGDA